MFTMAPEDTILRNTFDKKKKKMARTSILKTIQCWWNRENLHKYGEYAMFMVWKIQYCLDDNVINLFIDSIQFVL